jgi:hypothetical protein
VPAAMRLSKGQTMQAFLLNLDISHTRLHSDSNASVFFRRELLDVYDRIYS